MRGLEREKKLILAGEFMLLTFSSIEMWAMYVPGTLNSINI